MILPEESETASKGQPSQGETNRAHDEIHPPPPAYSSPAHTVPTRFSVARLHARLNLNTEPREDKSQRSVRALKNLRLFTLVSSSVLSAIALLVSVRTTITTAEWTGGYLSSVAMCICIAMLSVGTLPVMILLDRSKEVPFSSMIIVETIWLMLLSLLWMITGALTSTANLILEAAGPTPETGHGPGLGPGACFFVGNGLCHSLAGIQALTYTTWLILMVYAIILLALAVRAKKSSHRYVWTSSVKEGVIFAPKFNPKLHSLDENVDIPLVDQYHRSVFNRPRHSPYQTTAHASSSSLRSSVA